MADLNTSEHDSTIPNGSAWAGILAAAVGCFVLALLADFAAASPRISRAFNFYNPSGDLSGKAALAIPAWLIAWTVLHVAWRKRSPRSPGKIMVAAGILIVFAIIMILPAFMDLLAR